MNTAMLLAARFESPVVLLESVAEEFFGLCPAKARRRAFDCTLPVPAFRLGESQKAPWQIHVDDLAKHIDEQRKAAHRMWANSSTEPKRGA